MKITTTGKWEDIKGLHWVVPAELVRLVKFHGCVEVQVEEDGTILQIQEKDWDRD